MTEEALDVLDMASVAEIVKAEGGFVLIGKVWEKEKDEEGDERWFAKTRLHVATSEAQVCKLVKDYLRKNLGNENGVLDSDEEDGS